VSNKGEALFTEAGGKLLTFMMDDREYGIQILDTREVVKMMQPDPVPQTPDFMLGVINLRGNIIPVIDLRIRFGLKVGEVHGENCILVADLGGRKTGCLIDSLVGVATIERAQFEEHPDMGANIHTEFMSGIAKLKDRVIIILDMEQILKNEDLELLGQVTEQVTA